MPTVIVFRDGRSRSESPGSSRRRFSSGDSPGSPSLDDVSAGDDAFTGAGSQPQESFGREPLERPAQCFSHRKPHGQPSPGRWISRRRHRSSAGSVSSRNRLNEAMNSLVRSEHQRSSGAGSINSAIAVAAIPPLWLTPGAVARLTPSPTVTQPASPPRTWIRIPASFLPLTRMSLGHLMPASATPHSEIAVRSRCGQHRQPADGVCRAPDLTQLRYNPPVGDSQRRSHRPRPRVCRPAMTTVGPSPALLVDLFHEPKAERLSRVDVVQIHDILDVQLEGSTRFPIFDAPSPGSAAPSPASLSGHSAARVGCTFRVFVEELGLYVAAREPC